jgi:signal transduction histidine kinase
MLFKGSSLKRRLLIVFLGFTCMLGLLALISWWFYQRADSLNRFNYQVEGLLVEVFTLSKIEQDFFSHEIINKYFYESKKSSYLTQHQKLIAKTQTKLNNLLQDPISSGLNQQGRKFNQDLKVIKDTLKAYNQVFEKLVNLTLQRGFVENGLEGEMRQTAHLIEEMQVYPEKLLTLRRYEKDYLYRKDTLYLSNFIKLNKEFRLHISQEPILSNEQKTKVNTLLLEYQDQFYQLVSLESIIGLNYTNGRISGKRGLVRRLNNNLVASIEILLKDTDEQIINFKDNHYRLFLSFIVIMLLGSILLSYFLANRITRPIENLSRIIQQNVDNHFESPVELATAGTAKEVQTLNRNFNHMLLELREYLHQIKESNHKLNQQNEELNTNNIKLLVSEDRLSKLNSVKDKFLSIISHDLRAPLNTIVGFMQILEIDFQAFTQDEVMQFTSETQKSVNRLVNLLDNLLQWSLSETEDIKFEPETLNISQLASENVELYKATAEEKGVDFNLKIDINFCAYADTNMINFVFRNLLSNAIKFSLVNTQITLKGYLSEDRKKIHIEVKDQGVGISPKNLSKVFNPEEHFSTTGTSKEKGTGFGLLLCKNFVEQNGGNIGLESVLDEGTTVFFTLPSSDITQI